MAKPHPKPLAASQDEEPPQTISDGWVTGILFAVFAVLCALTWFLAHRAAVLGAPGAPLG